MKRVLVALFLLSTLGAAPANSPQFVFDHRIPAENQQMLEQALTEALVSQGAGKRARVIVELRVIEPQVERRVMVAEGVATPPVARTR